MRKRLAKKAFSKSYYQLWVRPDTGVKVWVPRNARCWGIIHKACLYYGHPEWFEKMSDSIVSAIEE